MFGQTSRVLCFRHPAVVLALLTAGLAAEPAGAQDAAAESATEPEFVTIDREPLRLTGPERYKVTLTLQPNRQVEIGPTTDGVVDAVLLKPGQRVDSKTEAARLDDREQQIRLKQVKAEFRAAGIELRRAKAGSDKDLIELAEARLEAAQAAVDLAELRLERTRLRVPFAGTVLRVSAGVGELIRAGTPVLQFGDVAKMRIEVPVDRKTVKEGATFEFRVEDRTVSGRVEAILPLAARFEPLREIVNSVASAVVVLDNASGEFQAGQTVYAPLIPRYAVTEIPTAAVVNGEGGTRQVQIVRKGVVHNVTIDLLAAVGEERTHVSGPFEEGDELIVSTSQPLADGARVAPVAGAPPAAAAAGSPARPAAGRNPRRTGQGTPGF